MGRPRKHNKHLPKCVVESHGAFYLVRAGKWEPLGKSLPAALAEYARRVVGVVGGLAALIDASLERMKPRLAANTIRQYTMAAKKLKHLSRDFTAPDQVKQKHVAQIKLLMADSPNMANRVLTFGRVVFAELVEQQLIDSNPFVGVRRNAERKRDRLLSAEEYQAIYAKAGDRLQVLMDLLFQTGQRVGDVLKIPVRNLTDDGIAFEQQKTGAKLVVHWTTDLRETVARAKALGGGVRSLTLLYNAHGKAPDYRTVADQWQVACEAAGVADAHLHDIRAMAATEVGKGAAGALLGHRSERTTALYMRGKVVPLVDGPAGSIRRLKGSST